MGKPSQSNSLALWMVRYQSYAKINKENHKSGKKKS